MTAQCSTLNLFGDQTLNGFLDLVGIELRWDLSASMVQEPDRVVGKHQFSKLPEN